LRNGNAIARGSIASLSEAVRRAAGAGVNVRREAISAAGRPGLVEIEKPMTTYLRTTPELGRLDAVLRRRVCSICEQRNADGSCDVDLRGDCVLTQSLPRIAECISRVRSENIEDYITAIRERICGECVDQHLDGSCERRKTHRCALDRHMVPIVWAVEAYVAAGQ
jgi:hypothetical protein